MTTNYALQVFDVIQDKYGAPYFPDDWKLKLLNMAQYEVLNRMIPDTLGGEVNVEFDENVFQNIKSLVYEITGTPDGSGTITNGILTSAVRTASGDTDATVFRILNVTYPGGLPTKYVRFNNYLQYQNNFFKKSSDSNPLYTLTAAGIKIFPITTSLATLTVIKTPKILIAGNTPDFDDYVMNQVILQALKLAGVAVRDEELIQDIRISGIQSGQ